MKNQPSIKSLLLSFAQNDERVRAVLLNGSRANPNVHPDDLQDYDVVFVVNEIQSFLKDHSWTNIFGDMIIEQRPDEMDGIIGEPYKFTYLMLFKDDFRIDLTLFDVQSLATHYKPDSLTIVWLDKDRLFEHTPPTSDKDYHINRPTEKEFLHTCNEFWWVSTYVVKGLLRNQMIYAKEHLECFVRPMFMKMIAWKIGIDQNFSVNLGNAYKFIEKYTLPEYYDKILKTYSTANIAENWQALLLMTQIFYDDSKFVANKLGFKMNKAEAKNTAAYIAEQFTVYTSNQS